jgi:saccharopine dehydrogenase-like NADP-dependent oxidoreductase
MQHIFKIQYPNKSLITHKSSLLMIGDKHGQSAMAKTVGIPTAIGAQLILDGKIKNHGVIIPIEKDVY